ncbi:MAG: ABC transporter permease [Gemmatimonadota bacterium]
MAGIVLRRLMHAVFVVLLVCTATFAIVNAAPGGPSLLADPKLTREEQVAIEERLGIDRPVLERYRRWLGSVATGDLGNSFLYQTDVASTIVARLPDTLLLAGSAILISFAVALPLGLSAAARPGGAVDRITGLLSVAGMSVPVFWLGIVMILLLAVQFPLLPAGGASSAGGGGGLVDRLRHLVLPALVLAVPSTAELVRYARSSARAAIAQTFIRTARAKGLRPGAVRWRHVARNAMLPVITAAGLQLPRLVGGAAVTETVFSWPGMGRLGVEAALARDYPLVMGVALLVSAGVAVATMMVDVACAALDPRISRQ